MAGKKTISPAGCEILNCTCQHVYQDKKYGNGRRVHNTKKCKSGGLEYKCTVCGKVRGGTTPPPVQSEEKK